MQLNGKRILLTGASGGLGEALARQLSAEGAALLLTGRDPKKLARIELPAGREFTLLQADLTSPGGIADVQQAAEAFGVDILINNAGVGSFGCFEAQRWPEIEQTLNSNLLAPLRLTHALLPWLLGRPSAAIVNIGSTFGSLPFAGFAAYSTAKAGLRGFSQALRRELADSAVRVFHVAPRAIRTALNSPAVDALNDTLGNTRDSPDAVARQIVAQLKADRGELHIGFPERLFAWLNGLSPSLIDQGVRGKLAAIRHHATAPH